MQSKPEGLSPKENGVAVKEEQDGECRISVCSLDFTVTFPSRRGDFEMAESLFS